MNINPFDFEKAKEGAIFVKKGDKLVETSFDELSKDLKVEVEKIPEMEFKFNAFTNSLKKLKKLSKSHFYIVFTLFEMKVLSGELEVDEELLELGDDVLNDKISVEDALKCHEFLEKTFNAIYGNEYDDFQKLGGK